MTVLGMLFGQFDQAGLDAAYNNRAHVPDHADYFARWAQQSEATRAALKHRADLAYGSWPRQRLDFFPAADRNAPLMVFIHGGYWQSLDHRMFDVLARPFVQSGIAFASMGYTLCPDIDMPGLVEQVREGIAWLWGRADALGFDRERLFVSGHSAGGHLVAMLAATDFTQRGLPRNAIKGGLSLSGLYDLEPVRLAYVNAALRLDAETARRMSPQFHLPSADAMPLLVAVGAAELPEFVRQQRDYHAALRSAGARSAAIELPGLHHFSVADALADPQHALHKAVRRMISRGGVV